MNVNQLRQYVIQPVLKYIGLYSDSAEEILVMTAAQESHMGEYIHQVGNGPALGIFQMEPFTFGDMWRRVLAQHPEIRRRVRALCGPWHMAVNDPEPEEMIGNLYLDAAMCRIKYFSISAALPPADQIEALAVYYKKYYNTAGGAATVQQVLDNYHRYAQAA